MDGVSQNCDFAKTIASPIPLQVISSVMGVPSEGRRRILEWSNRFSSADDPDYSKDREDSAVAGIALADYLFELGCSRRIEKAGPAERLRSNGFDGIKSLPLTLEP